MLGQRNMSKDWTSSRRIGRRIDRRLRAMGSGIGPRRADIAPRISELRSQLADWAIGRKRGRCAEESDEASRDQWHDRTTWLMLSINCLDRSMFYMCRINYDSKAWSKMKSRSQGHDHIGSSRVRRKSGRSSEVLEELAEKSQELAREARQNSPRRSSWSLGACRESVGTLPRVHRMFAGRLPTSS